jgi:Xaa-Pro dipeptidase
MTASIASLYDDHLRIQKTRTDAALEACGFDALAIYAGRAPMKFLDDQPYPFVVNPHFKAWAPQTDAQECWIVYRPGSQLQLIFLQPVDYWHKPPELPSAYWTQHFTIAVIRSAEEARSHLGLTIGARGRCAFIGDWQEEFSQWGFAATNPQQLLDRLHYSRAIKTAYEIECMRQASILAARGHIAAEAAFRAGASEYQIHLDFVRATQHTEAELPYSSIVALNQNAAVLHYQHLERRAPVPLHSFLIDAGAAFVGYAADVTRTYSSKPDDFATLVEGMHTLQLSLCSQVRKGVDYAQIHLDAHRQIAALLRASDVINVDADAAVATGLSAVFFPHGVGHLLGLQVHDVAGFMVNIDGTNKPRPPGHPTLRLTRTLEPGFAVTIEPGLYFIDVLLAQARSSSHAASINWQRVDEFRSCGGIRIEDNVVCTDGEPLNLTREAFASV